MRKALLLTLQLGMASVMGHAQHPQQHRMMLPAQNIDFSVDPPVLYSSPGSTLGTGTSDVSNGAHGPDGKMLFYVNKGHVINRYGQDIGALQNGTNAFVDNEIVIVPVRNSPCRYYIIYTFLEYSQDPSPPCGTTIFDKFKTYYALVDLSTNNGVGSIVFNGLPVDECSDIGFKSAMAAHWPDPASPNQYLYRAVASTSGIVIRRFTINTVGIHSPVLVANITTVNMPMISEMDISTDGSRLTMVNASFSNGPHDVLIVHLDGSGLLDTGTGNHGPGLSTFNVNNLSDGIFVGQEFTLNQQYLYVSHSQAGIYRVTLGTGAVSFLTFSDNHGNSQLEMSYHPTGDHRILAANSSGIGAIQTPEAITPTFNPNYISGAITAYDGLYFNSRLLPDQLDGIDYQGYQMIIGENCCKAFSFDALSYTVSGTGSVTWTPTSNPFYNQSVISIRDELVIPSGRTLTIQNLELRFDELARIRVMPNAHLIIDNSKLTKVAECGDKRWRGIYVSGNSTASQTQSPTLFGKLTVKNGAIIEHVQDGICNFGLTSGGTTDWSSFGGVIQATQSSFVNNRYGPFFGPYSNFLQSGGNQIPVNDLSYFDRCEFRTDNNFGSGTPIDQMTQWEVRGVAVTGCRFHNSRPSTDGNPVGRGRGIYSIDAVYTVKEHCSIIPPAGQPCPAQNRTPSRFEGLHRGIEATGGGVKPAVTTVWESEFTDNHRGVILSNTEGSKVQRNIFRPGLTGPEPVGLYIDQTSSYTVDCNTFTTVGGTAPVSNPDNRYGIASNHCGVASPIQKNTFTGLYVGAEAVSSNRNSAGSGLRYLSNGFAGNYVGVAVLQDGTLNQGIATNQGTSTVPAGNYFNPHSTYADFFNSSQAVNYRHHNGTSGIWYPNPQFGINRINTSVTWSMWTCEEKKKESMAMFNDETQEQAAKEAELTAITDGGSTQQLQTQVATTGHEADMQVYGTLMQKSPNLSEEVLLTAVERNAALPNAMLRDVLVSNPQAGKSQEVMTGLADRPQQLPEFMLWQVEESSAGVSPMENLRADVASLASKRQQTAEGLLDRWLMPEDGQPLQRDSAIALLTAKDDAHAHLRLALLHAAEGDAQAAAHHAGLMGQRADGPGAEASERMASLLTLLATANAESRSLGQLTEGELSTLTGLADGDDHAAGRADAIVAFVNGTLRDYPVLPLPPIPQQRRGMPSMDGMSDVKVFPNPGTDHVTIDFAFEEPQGNRQFEIVDVQGRTLLSTALVGQRDQKLIDIRSLAVGSYTYRVSDSGQTVASGIFTVGGR